MRILGPNTIFHYEGRIANIHPSLLPALPGATAYRRAKEKNVRIAGVTARYVTTNLDQDPIITQRAFDVPGDVSIDEIKKRGQPLEADAFLEAVKLHLNSGVSIHRGRTSLRESANSEHYQLDLARKAQASDLDRPIDGIVDASGEREVPASEPSKD